MLATDKNDAIGRMDRRVTIMQEIISDGESNEDKVTGYEPVDNNPNPWARVVNEIGDTVVEQDRVKHLQQTIFYVRYRTDVTIKNKIVHNGKMYSVLSAIEDGEKRKQRTKITGEYMKEYVIT
jgi:SPP1 family predicted phage head-tail adaptor